MTNREILQYLGKELPKTGYNAKKGFLIKARESAKNKIKFYIASNKERGNTERVVVLKKFLNL